MGSTRQASGIRVIPIDVNGRELARFVRFAWQIHAGSPYWVPPLIGEQIKFIRSGPYHEVGRIQPFLAYRDGQICGSIIAHYDRRHNTYFNTLRGGVGFFEAVNDTAVSRALFQAAEAWLAQQGMTSMCGPLNFHQYDMSGLLLDDYDNIPALGLGYNPPYYRQLFEDFGFVKDIDWYAYQFTPDSYFSIPPLLERIRDRVMAPSSGIKIRFADLKHFEAECAIVLSIFNRAWAGNHGHYPMTQGQFDFFVHELKPLIKRQFVLIAEFKGEPVGYMLSVPDANPALKAANGRLLPFGLLRMLWALRSVKRLRTVMMGVLPEVRGMGIDVTFYLETVRVAKAMGYRSGDCSIIAETNHAMLRALSAIGAQRYKTYRFFQKPLENGSARD